MEYPDDIARWNSEHMVPECVQIGQRLIERLGQDAEDLDDEILLALLEAWRSGWDTALTEVTRQMDERGVHINFIFGERA
jgi:hypothetical protein